MATKGQKSNGGKGATHIRDLQPDRRNARKHNPQNIGMIADSLRAVGAARSIVIDENDEVLAGNGLVEAAAEAGITRVQVVEADGDTVIAVRRRNLTPEQKLKLAIYDNRTAELAEWDVDVLREFAVEGLDLAPFEFDSKMLEASDAASASQGDVGVTEQYLIVLTCRDESHQRELLDRFLAEGMTCRALTS